MTRGKNDESRQKHPVCQTSGRDEFSAVACAEHGGGQSSQLVMIANEIFIDANVSFGILPLPQNNSGRTFLFQVQSFLFVLLKPHAHFC